MNSCLTALIGNPKEADKKLFLSFPRFLRFQKKLIITKSSAAKPFAFARYMKYEIGEDASVVLVVFLFNSDKLPIIFAKLKKTRYGWTDRWMDGQMDIGMDRWTNRLIEMSRRF